MSRHSETPHQCKNRAPRRRDRRAGVGRRVRVSVCAHGTPAAEPETGTRARAQGAAGRVGAHRAQLRAAPRQLRASADGWRRSFHHGHTAPRPCNAVAAVCANDDSGCAAVAWHDGRFQTGTRLRQRSARSSALAARPSAGGEAARQGWPPLPLHRPPLDRRPVHRPWRPARLGKATRRAPFARPATVRARVSGRIGPIGPRIAAVRAGGRITRLGGENWARARSSSFSPFHPELIRPSRPRSGRTGPLLSHVDHAVLVGRSAVDWERRAARFSARLRSRSPAASSGDHLGRPPTLAEHARPRKR